MARHNRILRDATIKKHYQQLNQQKKYTLDYILNELANKYFLAPRTIENIVFKKELQMQD
jgi:hypothetical protein